MRTLSVALLSLLFFSCKSVSYFNSPNDAVETPCILYMTNGSQDTGRISIAFETGHDVKSQVSFTKNKQRARVPIESIKYYEVNGALYFPKIVDIDLNGSEHLLFLKRLTAENSRIQFFELTQKRLENSIMTDFYNYFIVFPSQDAERPVNIASIKLVPNFNQKMSRQVADCPELALKIENSNTGYFLPSYSLGNKKKRDVFLRIIAEYNACK